MRLNTTGRTEAVLAPVAVLSRLGRRVWEQEAIRTSFRQLWLMGVVLGQRLEDSQLQPIILRQGSARLIRTNPHHLTLLVRHSQRETQQQDFWTTTAVCRPSETSREWDIIR